MAAGPVPGSSGPPPPSVFNQPAGGQPTPPPPADTGTVVTTNGPRKGWAGSKKIVLTILGILILVGGAGAGVFLVQQQQELRKKAAGDCSNISWCATFTCPNGDTDGDGQCGLGDNGASQAIGSGKNCLTSSCGQTDYYYGEQGNFDNFCYNVFNSNFPDCSGGDGTGTGDRDVSCEVGVKVQSTYCTTDEIVIQANWNLLKEVGMNHKRNSGFTQGSLDLELVDSSVTKKDVAGGFKRIKGFKKWRVLEPVVGTYTFQAKGEIRSGGSLVKDCQKQKTFTIQECGPTLGGQCDEIKFYDSAGTLLTAADLVNLKAGDTLRLAARASVTGGTVDKAVFTVNGTALTETTSKQNDEFYSDYTIPAGTTSFEVSVLVHHLELDQWF